MQRCSHSVPLLLCVVPSRRHVCIKTRVQWTYDRTFGNKRHFAKIGIRVEPHSDPAQNEFVAPERLRYVHHRNIATNEPVIADASDVAHSAMLQVPWL